VNDPADDLALTKGICLHHIRIPVSDVMNSSDWFAETFGFETILITEDEDMVTGVVMTNKSGLFVGFHFDEARSAALGDFPVIGLAVSDFDSWPAFLDAKGTAHSEVIDSHLGRSLCARGPGELAVEIHTPIQPSTDEA
jgi:catechol 2,3-dioxygenase-like lactoylglutathione lyase family enzyme